MIQRNLNDKIAPIIKCTPTVYTLTASIFSTTTPLLIVALMHTPRFIFKVMLLYSMLGLVFSFWQWASLIIAKK